MKIRVCVLFHINNIIYFSTYLQKLNVTLEFIIVIIIICLNLTSYGFKIEFNYLT